MDTQKNQDTRHPSQIPPGGLGYSFAWRGIGVDVWARRAAQVLVRDSCIVREIDTVAEALQAVSWGTLHSLLMGLIGDGFLDTKARILRRK